MDFENLDSEDSGGYIIISRSILNHWLWNNKTRVCEGQAWLDLVFRANHKKTKDRIDKDFVEIQRGQVLTSKKKLAQKWRWDISAVNNFLSILIKDDMIEVQTGNRYTLITLKNYTKHQLQQKYIKKRNSSTASTTHPLTNSEPTDYKETPIRQPIRQPTNYRIDFEQQNRIDNRIDNPPVNSMMNNNLDENHISSTTSTTDDKTAYGTATNNTSSIKYNKVDSSTGENGNSKIEKTHTTKNESSPPAPSPFQLSANAVMSKEDCLKHFLVDNQFAVRARDQLLMTNMWLRNDNLLERWGTAFNRFLDTKFETHRAYYNWFQGFLSWFKVFRNRTEINPDKLDMGNPIETTNSKNNFKNGKSSTSKQSEPKFGGIGLEATREFYSRFRNHQERPADDEFTDADIVS